MSVNEKSRGDRFVSRIPTDIWLEEPASKNAYVAKKHYCHGFEHKEIIENLTYSQNLHLLLTGSVANERESRALDYLMTLPLAIGPRHPASRAAMNAGVSRTKIQHLLPISLQVLSGENGGSVEVYNAYKFIQSQSEMEPKEVYAKFVSKDGPDVSERVAPGFGTVYGDVDLYIQSIADQNESKKITGPLKWAFDFNSVCLEHGYGWLLTGYFAALCLEYGYSSKQAVGIFQIACSPLLYSLGLEKSEQAITSMPFILDENYTIE